jgi:hypothetical protein
VFLFLTLNWNESCCLRYKQDKLQFTARNYIMLSVCRKLLASAAVVVAAWAAGGGGGGGGDVI